MFECQSIHVLDGGFALCREGTLMKINITATGPGILLLLVVLLLSAAVTAQDSPELSWKKSEGAESFEAAKAAYEASDFKSAYAKFKEARKQAKNRSTRSHVDLWLGATEGANVQSLPA